MMLALHGFGPAQTGLLAIPGAAGILMSQPAGRWSDRYGAFPIVTAGVGLVLAAYVVLAFAPLWIGAVIAGAVLLDSGLRSAMVANQTRITRSLPTRAAASTPCSAHTSGRQRSGAFLASTALAHWGWPAVCAIAMARPACAAGAVAHAERAIGMMPGNSRISRIGSPR